VRILHAIHDFLPRHRAGSEIYALELCRELGKRHHATLVCAEFEPARPHGHVTWRVHQGVPIVELTNNWTCGSFEDTYRPPLIGERIEQVLHAVQPDVIHVHSLLNLSFDLPTMARARGIPVVATLHDYSLVCPSGGQRIHRRDEHLCESIDTERCARCFRESPIFAHVSLGRVAGALPSPGFVRRAARALARRQPRVAARLAAAAARTPLLPVTAHDVDRRLEAARRVFDNVDLFVAPSRSVAREFERLGIDPTRLRVSDYGFPPPAPSTGRPPRDPRAALRIGYVGTLAWHKGVHVLMEAVRQMPAGACELRVFGDPDVFPAYTASLRAFAAGLPVRFMGPFDRDCADEAYSQIDVLVVPSLWLENSPLVVHEAFMAGVPVVAARIGGLPELVEDGRNGLLYDPRSPAELATALRRLVDDPEALERLARARPAVKAIGEDAEAWEAAYADVIGRGEMVGAAV
jgi:glycosyltransferase involved in cell wall biosynthesis